VRGIHHLRVASGFATARACSMKSRATGPSVRVLFIDAHSSPPFGLSADPKLAYRLD
jgi:hypothetical protein